MKGWLDKYNDGGRMQEHQENYNDSSVSMPKGFVGMGNNTKGRNYSPAWGGQFEKGGEIPRGQTGLWTTDKKGYVDSTLNANKNLDWVKRMYDPHPKAVMVPGEEHPSTHLMGDNDQGYVFPQIVNMNGQLVDLGNRAEDYARETNTGIQFPKEQGTWFARSTSDKSGYKMGTGVMKGKPVMQKYKSINKHAIGGKVTSAQDGEKIETNEIPVDPITDPKYKEAIKKGTEFSKNWMNSPMYREMLLNSVGGNEKEYERINNRRKANLENISFTEASFDPVENARTYYPNKKAPVTSFNRIAEDPDLINDIVHEEGHASDRGGINIPLSDKILMGKYATHKVKQSPMYEQLLKESQHPEEFDKKFRDFLYTQINLPTETRARILGLRKIMSEQGIYDPFTQHLTKEGLEKYKPNLSPYNIEHNESVGFDPYKQLQMSYTDEEILDMMNKVSKNEDKQPQTIAAMGGSFPGSVGFTYARTGSIPSNGPYAKKTKASAQKGKEVPIDPKTNPTYTQPVSEAIQFTKDWMNSPMYQKMLLQSFDGEKGRKYEDIDRLRKEAINDDNIDYYEESGDPSMGAESFSPIRGKSSIYFNTAAKYPDLLHNTTHELSHITDKGGYLIPKADKKLMESYAVHDIKESPRYQRAKEIGAIDDLRDFTNYVNKPTETRARINSFRKLLLNQGVYNPFTQPFSKDMLSKYKQLEISDEDKKAGYTIGADPYQQLKISYTDEEIEDMMNKISKADNKQAPIAENGMTFYQHGLDWKPKSMETGGWLDKYEVPKNQNAKYTLPNARDLARQMMGSNESTSLGTKIDEAAIRQASIDAQRKKQGQIRKAEPTRSAASKAWAIATHPMTALSYKVKGQDIPENFERGERNILENAVDVVNPFSYIDQARQVKEDVRQGNYLAAGVGALGFIPGEGAIERSASKFLNKEKKSINELLHLESLPEKFRGPNAYKIKSGDTWIGDFDLEKDGDKWIIGNVGLGNEYRGKGLGKESFIKANELIKNKGEGVLHSSGNFYGEDAKNVWKSLVKEDKAEQIGNDSWRFKKKKGGIVKDDNGYWNPDNWGKTVEIGSPHITMKGVNEPLLGISDKGDAQMMFPGEEYKFKGKKVTEFPMKKNGGWLDKYK